MWSIARHTFLELIRDRILWSLVIFGVVLVIGASLLEQLSIGREAGKLIMDMGLGALSLLLLLVVFFVGSLLLWREFQERTIYIVFSSPLPRSQFVLGKFLGMSLLLLVLTLGFGGLLLLLFWLKGIGITLAVFQSIGAIFVESVFVLSLLLFLSTLLSPLLTSVCSLLLFIAGSSMPFLQEYMSRHPGSGLGSMLWVYYLFPNFGIFHIADAASYGFVLSAHEYGAMMLYGLCYSGLFLLGSIFFINRKEL